MTQLEIEEAIREAWLIVQAGSAASPSAHRLAAALLAVTGDTPAHPHWVTPDDLWRDRLAILGSPFEIGVGRMSSASISVVQPDPAHGATGFIAAFGGEVEPVERTHQQLGAAMIG